MAHINLLPWRERLREERKLEFIAVLVGVVVVAFGMLFGVDRYYVSAISAQTSRNQFIQNEIRLLDERVAEINQLREQKEDIRARMSVISDLQGTRPVIVRVFDEVVRTLPDGVYYDSLNRTNDTMAAEGVSESYSGITELMRNLEESEWFRFKEDQMFDITADPSPENPLVQVFSFSLSFDLELPDQQEEEV